MPQTANRNRLTKYQQEQVRKLIEQVGLRPAAAEVGVHAQTLATLAAGLTANRSTVALVERRLAEMAVEQPPEQPDG